VDIFRNAALWSFLYLRSSFKLVFIILRHLRDLLSGEIISRHNKLIMKLVADYSNNRFLSMLSICCSSRRKDHCHMLPSRSFVIRLLCSSTWTPATKQITSNLLQAVFPLQKRLWFDLCEPSCRNLFWKMSYSMLSLAVLFNCCRFSVEWAYRVNSRSGTCDP